MFHTGVILIDHGSRRVEANAMLEQVAALMRKNVDDEVFVTHAHMELAEPDLKQAVELCLKEGIDRLIVHPYMLSPGKHASRDIPEMVEAIARNHPSIRFRVTEALGLHQGLIDAVKDRCGL
ncbi:MAG: sirohydrochlorin cobaltochelatase [Myxococcales bacterium]|nr:MAG: sirohydrochlorin cobaltochelatase [Myxococcales bacterium]